MKFEWDERKDRGNVKKHLITFDEASAVFDSQVVTVVDDRGDYGEDRFLSIGIIDTEVGPAVIVVAHTKRGDETRIISARPANRKERRRYYEFIQGQAPQETG